MSNVTGVPEPLRLKNLAPLVLGILAARGEGPTQVYEQVVRHHPMGNTKSRLGQIKNTTSYCLKWLEGKGYVHQASAGAYALTRSGVRLLESPSVAKDGLLQEFMRDYLRRKAETMAPQAREPEASVGSIKGTRGIPVVDKLISLIPSMSLDRLYALWTNAEAKLAYSADPEVKERAERVMGAISNERARRGPLGDREGGKTPFRWPSTVAKGGSGGLKFDAPSKGMLSEAGYRVGRSLGEPERLRRLILAKVYEHQPANGPDLGEGWGEPGTAGRLRKMAVSIAAYIRNAKRRKAPMDGAITEWEEDLEWLKRRYYDGCYSFDWPDASVAVPVQAPKF